MKIKKIEWRNFNSYGNIVQSLDFTDAGCLFNLHGENGAGKSSISEVMTFALYGKVEKKNKADLVNRANKNMWTCIELECRGKTVRIERGASPNVLVVAVDSKEIDIAGISNVQEYLEEELFEIPYAVFKNILVLSINDFKSFLSMTPADKRNIIDKLFGFSVINQMRELVKGERKELREVLQSAAAELKVLTESVEGLEQKVDDVRKRKGVDPDAVLAEIKQKMDEIKAQRKKVDAEMTKASDFRRRLGESRMSLASEESRLASELAAVRSKLTLFKGGKCPYCESDLTDDAHAEFHRELASREDGLVSRFDAARKELASASTKASALADKERALTDGGRDLDRRVQQLLATAKQVMELKGQNLDAIVKMKEDYETRAKERSTELDDAQGKDAFLGLVEGVLSEGGVKGHAMGAILPSLNQAILTMARKLRVPYDVRLDESFDCVVQSVDGELSARTLSSGEKKKVDVAIVVALIKMLKVRYPALNILFLDEIFASIDTGGIYEISKILSELCREHAMNIWVMHHAELPNEMFDKQVTVVKENGFSAMQVASA